MEEPRAEGRGFRKRPSMLEYVGLGGLDKDSAQAVAEEAVRDVRGRNGKRMVEAPAPNSVVVRERREARQQREARQPSNG